METAGYQCASSHGRDSSRGVCRPRALPKSKDGTLTGKLSMHSVKNIFYIISDGTGPETVAAYRYYRDTSASTNDRVKSTIFDSLLVGMQRTYSLNRGVDCEKDKYKYVTDSAAGATALNAGVKTLNGYVSVDENRNNVETLMEFAKEREDDWYCG